MNLGFSALLSAGLLSASLVFGRDAFDVTLDPDEFSSAKAIPREGMGQLVDVPNVGVTAILPLDIFVGSD